MMLTVKRAAVAVLALLLIGLTWQPVSESDVLKQSETGLQRALTTYGVARALNAVISVAQGTEVSIEPFGIGATLALGQVLDPINDIIEQFSSLMLFASVAFGLQILLIKIGAHALISVALTVVAIACAVLVASRGSLPNWLGRVLLVLVLARFAAPVCTWSSEQVYRGFLEQEYVTAQSGLEGAREKMQTAERQLNKEAEQTEVLKGEQANSFMQWLRDKVPVPSMPKIPDVKKIGEDIKQAANSSVQHMINLMVVFLLQTVVLPLLFLWAFAVAGRSAISSVSAHAKWAAAPN